MSGQPPEGRRRIELAAAALLAAAFVGALSYLAFGAGVSGEPELRGPFGQHYDGLEQRRKAAGVPTMGERRGGEHAHVRLRVYVRGKRIAVPAGIGIDPERRGPAMAALHTHSGDGTIHVEGMPGARLGQFFAVWGVPLSANRLGRHRARGAERVRAWVDGRPAQTPGSIELRDGRTVVIRLEKTPEP